MYRLTGSLCALAFLTSALAPVPALASQPGQQEQGDQASARAAMKAGRSMPIGEIERRIVRRMGDAEYLGFEYDRAASAYRLKFIENGKVIWVDVDAKTSNVLRISR